MPMQSVILRPGVDVERTLALNEAGISQSQLIRTKNGLTQTVGGWVQFTSSSFNFTSPSTVRDLHAWQDVHAGHTILGVGATENLLALTAVAGHGPQYRDITPQSRVSSTTPLLSVSSGSNIITVLDSGSGVSNVDTVVFETPIAISNLFLYGAYPVITALTTGSFTIQSSINADTTVVSSGTLPVFTTSNESPFVTVVQSNHNALAIVGIQQTYIPPTSVGGLTIQGVYGVRSVLDSSSYIIAAYTAASTAATATMNGGNAQYRYYVTPTVAIEGIGGYGAGGYGVGGYGVGGIGSTSTVPGTPITVENWSLDNWGEILIAGQKDGPVFYWQPSGGVGIAQVVSGAPLKNGGCFVSMPQQILVCWKSVQTLSNQTQDNLIVRWSDAQDFTNFEVSDVTAAGSFHIPTGSVIRGGLQAPNYGVIWTDVDAWVMQFVGISGLNQAVFNFTRVASGCGLIGQHAAGVLVGNVWWCGEDNFYVLSGSGVEILPCTVWDFIFNNMNRDAKDKIFCEPNSVFSEIAWSFPYGDSTENNAYVKYNVADKTWDYGTGGLARTAWVDHSVVGNPIGTDTFGVIYEHEVGVSLSGGGASAFLTGWWAVNDGQELGFVDFIMPDFIWGEGSGYVQLMFFSVDYPGDVPRTYGPYTVTQATQYLTPRIRGRLISMEAIAVDVFVRLGRIRYRWAPAGRR